MGPGLKRINSGDLANHQVYQPGRDEIYAPLYDSVVYPLAGTTQLNFFSTPIGQGTTSAPGATGTKTEADTNMRNAGMLTKGQAFFCTGIELVPIPGVNPGFGATADASIGRFINDIYAVGKAGWLKMVVMDRTYILDGPLWNFPTTQRIVGLSAVATNMTTGAATAGEIDYATWGGMPYQLVPLYITENMGFSVQLNFPAAVATVSTQNMRLFCRLRGRFIRNVQ